MMGGDGNGIKNNGDYYYNNYDVDEGNGIVTDGDGGEIESKERQDMLDRLDDMLVVPPHLEIDENGSGSRNVAVKGQFDDANEVIIKDNCDDDDEIL